MHNVLFSAKLDTDIDSNISFSPSGNLRSGGFRLSLDPRFSFTSSPQGVFSYDKKFDQARGETMRAAFLTAVLFLSCLAQAQLDDILKKADETLNQRNTAGLSNGKIVAGLKEALQVSTGKAVALTGKPDGFLKNEAIKILLPPKLQTVGKGMRMLGMGAQVDDLEVGMNRAAEQATPQAKRIFMAAVKKMTFDDARKILTGSDTAATEYFKRSSSEDLTTAFSPIVNRSLRRVGVVQQYDRVLASAPGGGALAGQFDLNKYVVGKTLEGLFLTLGEEEKRIRKDPAAQTTSLLKEVFGRK
jgi:hypothetical protein